MVSTGWVAAGVAAIVIGRAPALAERPRAARALRLGGGAPAAGALVGVLVSLKLEVAGRTVRTAAVRPAIWGSALTTVATFPLIGVGAAPFLATAPDPWGGPVPRLWDAHQAYLSVVGQFGIVWGAL